MLDFPRGEFKMPKHPSWLLPAESAAGMLDDEDFLIHVADILHILRRRLTSACDVSTILRDRYHLAQIVRLAPSPNNKCGYCREYISATYERIIYFGLYNEMLQSQDTLYVLQ